MPYIQPMENDNKRKRSSYSKAKKIEVVQAYKTGKHTMLEVTNIFGIKHPSIVHRWVKEFNQGKLHATKRGARRNVKGTKPYNEYASRENGTKPYNTTKDTPSLERKLGQASVPPITPFNLPNGTQLISRVNGKEPGFGDNHVHITLEAIVLPIQGESLVINRGMANEIAELFETPNLITTLKGRAK